MLNEGTIPKYFADVRIVPLSKQKRNGIVKVDQIRPIGVRSHLCKVTEKALLIRFLERHSHLIKTEIYLTGFQPGKSTALNVEGILLKVAKSKRSPTKRRYILLIDLNQAYNSVKRK